MHRDLQEHLKTARGQSKDVVAVFLDIHGFTSWGAESTNAATFLKAAYNAILTRHFTDADYFKLTGDGMMVIYSFDDESLQRVIRMTVAKSIALVDAFPRLTKKDLMINYPVPQLLGVGLARGAATVLKSGDKTLDYTGAPLNLAARLMDLARPSGVVFDDSFGIELLTPANRKKFAKDAVYIRGIAEETPRSVYILRGKTRLSEFSKLPIIAPVRVVDSTEKTTLANLEERGSSHWKELLQIPARTDDGRIHLSYPKAKSDGSRNETLRRTSAHKIRIEQRLMKWYALIDYGAMVREMKKNNCQPTWPVRTTIEYSVREAGPSSE